MREILFRGKRLDNGGWVEGYLLRPNPEVCRAYERDECVIGYQERAEGAYILFEVDPDTVGQYTGLPDKNGERIFEWDIVRYRDESVGAVVFADGAFGVAFGDDTSDMFLCFAAELCEVIGNIHDNPELLEG